MEIVFLFVVVVGGGDVFILDHVVVSWRLFLLSCWPALSWRLICVCCWSALMEEPWRNCPSDLVLMSSASLESFCNHREYDLHWIGDRHTNKQPSLLHPDPSISTETEKIISKLLQYVWCIQLKAYYKNVHTSTVAGSATSGFMNNWRACS